jgi:hypothetical protein
MAVLPGFALSVAPVQPTSHGMNLSQFQVGTMPVTSALSTVSAYVNPQAAACSQFNVGTVSTFGIVSVFTVNQNMRLPEAGIGYAY